MCNELCFRQTVIGTQKLFLSDFGFFLMVEGHYNHKIFEPELQPRTINSSIDNFLPRCLKTLGFNIWVEMSVIEIFCPNVSTTPITAMGCRQCLPLSVVQLKGKHCHCCNRVIDMFRLYQNILN